jgi:lysyl-tRNA synthetase class 2
MDLSPPGDRLAYFEGLERAVGEDLSSMDERTLRSACREHGVEVEQDASVGKMLDELFSELVGKKLLRPTFVIDHPKLLSPLAKAKRAAPHLVERFEPYLGGLEIGNGFSELNDPLEQRARFEEQLSQAGRDEDRMILDEPFLRAMEHGMPPASGLGIGVDRLAMLLTGATQLREVILFPAMRREGGDGEEPSDESP